MSSTPKHWLVGQRIGYLFVVSQCGNTDGTKRAEFLCSCICGKETIRHYNSLKIAKERGLKSSCGCRGKARAHEAESWYTMMMQHTIKRISELHMILADQKMQKLKSIDRILKAESTR